MTTTDIGPRTFIDPKYDLSDRSGWDKVEYAGRDGITTGANGNAMLAVAHQPAWHGLGTVCTNGETLTEMARIAQILGDGTREDLTFSKVPAVGPNGNLVTPARWWVQNNLTTDVFPELVGAQFTPIQPRESIAFAQAIVEDSAVVGETIGMLGAATAEQGGKAGRGGARGEGHSMFLSLRIPIDMTLDVQGRTDVIIWYLMLLDSFDGRGKFRAVISPYRPVCRNSVRFATRDAVSKWEVRHTTSVADRVEEARTALGLTAKYADTFQGEAEQLLAAEVTLAEVDRLLLELFPKPEKETKARVTRHTNIIEAIRASYLGVPVGDNVRGTLWGVEQAVGHYYDWGQAVQLRGTDATKARAERMVVGEADEDKDRVHQRLMAMV